MYPFFGGDSTENIFKMFHSLYTVENQPVNNQSCAQKSYLETFNYRNVQNLTQNATHFTILGIPMSKDNFTLIEENRHELLNDYNEWDFPRTVILTLTVFSHYFAILLA